MCSKIFADDTKLYVAINHAQIQNGIGALKRWSDKWNRYFNTAKCKVMHIGSNNERCNHAMRLSNGEIVNITKCVIFDSKLIFDLQIQAASIR